MEFLSGEVGPNEVSCPLEVEVGEVVDCPLVVVGGEVMDCSVVVVGSKVVGVVVDVLIEGGPVEVGLVVSGVTGMVKSPVVLSGRSSA